jgi:ubiquilin
MSSEEVTTGEAQESQVTFKVKTSADGNHTITMAESATVLDLKKKLAGDDFEKVSTDRMRLIYSGRVMKDPDTLATYKIKSGNTIHMVKSAASNAAQKPAPATPSAGGASSAAAGVPTNMAAGTANNPLAALTGARYAGHVNLPGMDMFGADGGMGAPPSEDQLATMLDDPNMQQMMNEALSNPQMVDMMINSIPGLANNPQARAMLSDPAFRRMLTSPETLRQAATMRRLMGGAGGAGAFPAPGATDTTPTGAASSNPSQANQTPFNLFAIPGGFGGAGAPGGNPFAALFGGAPGQTPVQTPPTASSTGQGTPLANPASPDANAQNPFANLFGGAGGQGGLPPITPEALQQMQQAMQAFQGGNPFAASPFGASSPPPPADTRPPEERYASQLRQLNDMGFYDFDRNVEALRRSGGSVQGAIEQLLS